MIDIDVIFDTIPLMLMPPRFRFTRRAIFASLQCLRATYAPQRRCCHATLFAAIRAAVYADMIIDADTHCC